MADYKGIKGFTIPNVSSDPSNPILGQIWYNSTSGTLKGEVVGVGTWASGGSLNITSQSRAGFGTQTTAYACGGESPGSTILANVENYNGSSWTETTDLNTARTAIQGGGDGSATAGLVFGGESPSLTGVTESWNGTSWTEVTDLNTARRYMASTTSGTNTAVLAFGGLSPSATAVTEQWNGTSWTEVNDLNTARYGQGGFGTTTAAISASGASPPISNVEDWNGTSWTEVADVNTARRGLGSSGNATDGLVFGGDNPSKNAETESFDGTSWTEVGDLSTARAYGATGGITSTTEALFAGGQTLTNITEEWNKPDTATVTVTTS